MTFNGNGLGDEIKLRKVLNWAGRYKPHILLLQETHCAGIRTNWYDKYWGGKCIHSSGGSNKKGVSILLSKNFDYKIVSDPIIDDFGRYIIVDLEIESKRYLVGNYYGVNTDRPEHLEHFLNMMYSTDGQEIIIGGDFNFVWDVHKDKKGGLLRTHFKSRDLLKEWCINNECLDIWRAKNPSILDYTWRSGFAPYIFCRLDFFITSSSICNRTDTCVIKPGYKSDHKPVILKISDNTDSRGGGFWKLNVSLLSKPAYIKLIKTTINMAIEENKGADPNLLLDTVKCRIRGASIKYSSFLKKQKANNFQTWTCELEKLQNQLSLAFEGTDIRRIKMEIDNKTEQLNRLIEEDTAGAILRSRVQNYEEGERNTKYFYNLEKTNNKNKTITNLITDRGKIEGNDNILNEEVRYYKQLYSSQITKYNPKLRESVFSEFFVKQHPTVDAVTSNDMTTNITEYEIYNTLESFSDKKCPGSDGLPKEFYILFWVDIKTLLLNSYNHSLNTGSLSIDQKRGIINLIPKKDKDTCYLANWRPLTLLNTDYKILAKLIADRFKYLLPKLIADDQTGFVPERYIGCNINRLMNILNHCNENNIEGMLISIDFEKAFDSMEWDFVFRAMAYFGFSSKFIGWIRTLYNGIESCTTNNGHISNYFKLERGVRQGCPLSPYLFILGAEILGLYIRQSALIPHIYISEYSSSISQYADDTTIITFRNNNILRNTFRILRDFNIISGLKVNEKKTQIMEMGNLGQNKLYHSNIVEHMIILGIDITHDRSKLIELNYNPIMNKIKICLNIWRQRNLSLFGRIEIVKGLAISRLVYVMSMLPSPSEDYFKEIDTILNKFIWKDKPAKIRGTVLRNLKENGGANMMNIRLQDKCLKLNWITRLCNNSGCWKECVLKFLPVSENNIDYFFNGNLKVTDLSLQCSKNSIWTDIIKYWCEFNYVSADDLFTRQDVLATHLWLNSNIRIRNHPVFWKEWFNNGLEIINDMMDELTGNLLSWKEIKNKFNLNGNYLNYYSLISALPKSWKIILGTKIDTENNSSIEVTESIFDKLMTYPKATRGFYKYITDNSNDQPYDRLEKWNRDLEMEYDDLDWYELINECYRCTVSVQLRSFIYKFAMRDLFPKSRLLKMKLATSATCDKCHNEPEDILHMFWTCPTIIEVWKEMEAWISNTLGINLVLDAQMALMNITDIDVSFFPVITLILTLVKQTIYYNRESKIQVTKANLIRVIYKNEYIERAIAISKNRLNKHANKWQGIYRTALIGR